MNKIKELRKENKSIPNLYNILLSYQIKLYHLKKI